MKHEDAVEAAKAELKPLERLLAQPAEALKFEQAAKPLIQCCFAYEDGFPLEGYENQSYELLDRSRLMFAWETVPISKGRCCVQLNRAARALHYRIRDVHTSGVTNFEGVATMVFLPLYREGTIMVDVHRLRPEAGMMRLQEVLAWLLSEYLLEFDGYDRLTFIDWIVSNLHLSPAELGGAEALEDWYRKRAQHISEQGQEGDAT
jgi:hypothetical protein